ncbi:MAG: hypothetical protein IJQ07_04605 [Clostridia bacterium]|nr:hypothetical protein [Clostridia bacterium]
MVETPQDILLAVSDKDLPSKSKLSVLSSFSLRLSLSIILSTLRHPFFLYQSC